MKHTVCLTALGAQPWGLGLFSSWARIDMQMGSSWSCLAPRPHGVRSQMKLWSNLHLLFVLSSEQHWKFPYSLPPLPESPGSSRRPCRAKSSEGSSLSSLQGVCVSSPHLTPSLCPRYEEEVSLRATAENEFVALKKASSRWREAEQHT